MLGSTHEEHATKLRSRLRGFVNLRLLPRDRDREGEREGEWNRKREREREGERERERDSELVASAAHRPVVEGGARYAHSTLQSA